MRKIIITHTPITTPLKAALSVRKSDRDLVEAICEYRKKIETQDCEIFKRYDNILVTESGYFYAFYEGDVDIEKVEEPLKPYIGNDGRQKVLLIDENGQTHEEDLAVIVAKTFIPNPGNYAFVKFKDNNLENCTGDNLYWSETP